MDNGRLDTNEMEHVIDDNPSSQTAAMLTKQDEVIDKVNEVLLAIDTATDAASLYAALAALDLTAITKIELKK